ncbi:GNAT family N-acetyltransferase [Halospeciosus flavus]|uniref:GNAT family N-acetyltransferase n=1 Tax=Halospeciosus flavus TaxID=3032283 RepID=A0ABD5Z4G0_9EURY|nr:GNAT family N-acetyltransferase [Halospeciosus flavus]
MDVRKAVAEDADDIRRVAEASLSESYAELGESMVESAVEKWYDPDTVDSHLADDDYYYRVAVVEDEVVAFVEYEAPHEHDTVGEIYWLHVHPDHRGEGYGARLLEEAEVELMDTGVTRIRARVLATNESGNEFYAEHGYQFLDDVSVEIGDETYVENTYLKLTGEDTPEPLVEERVTPDGETVYVSFDERDHGSKAPFYAVYRSPELEDEERYGLFCGNCDSFDTAMDSMGRIECNECGNRRKPSRWDAAYL